MLKLTHPLHPIIVPPQVVTQTLVLFRIIKIKKPKNYRKKPKNYRNLAITSCIFCWMFGLLALMYSRKVSRDMRINNYAFYLPLYLLQCQCPSSQQKCSCVMLKLPIIPALLGHGASNWYAGIILHVDP